MKVVDRNELITLIRRKGGRASSSMSDAALASEANRLGMGAKKMGSNPGRRSVPKLSSYIARQGAGVARARGLRPERSADGTWWIEGDAGIDVLRGPYRTRKDALKALGGGHVAPHPSIRRALRGNPGPDPYRKDVLVMTPGGVSYTGPYGPFGSREWQPGLRGNPRMDVEEEDGRVVKVGKFNIGDRVMNFGGGRRWTGHIYQFDLYHGGSYGFDDNEPIAIVERSDGEMDRVPLSWLKIVHGKRKNPVGAMDDYLLIAPPAPAAPTASNPAIEEFGGFRRGDRVRWSPDKKWGVGIIYQFAPYGGYGFGDQPVVIVERSADRQMVRVPLNRLKKLGRSGHRNPPMGDYLQIAGNPVGDYLQINPGLPRPGEIVPGRAGRAGRRNPRAKNSPFHKGDEVFVPSGHRGVVASAAKGGKVRVKLARGGTMSFRASSLVHCDPSCHTHGMF